MRDTNSISGPLTISPNAPSFYSRYARELGLVGSILILLAVPMLFPHGSGFYTASVFRGLVMDNLSVLIAAIGMTLIILCAEIDISIAAQLAVCGVVAGTLSRLGLPIIVVIPVTIACGAVLGLINGALVSWLSIPSIVATLAMWVLLENGLIVVTKGVWVQNLPDDFQWFGLGLQNGQIVFVTLALIVLGLFAFLLKKTEFGRSFYAVGCSHEAALRLRIQPKRVVSSAFVILGALMGLAAVIHYCRYPEIETGAGRGFELQVIAAVVVGGTAISGGRGSLLGTLLGVILMGVVTAVLAFTPLESTADKAVQGAIILIAVVADRVFQWGRGND
jgi:rhamnose transport system permease protein|tara:strand:+ start:563 stop:1564 length:1002 start_codon:yes stop_codon:yes gene_type:complete